MTSHAVPPEGPSRFDAAPSERRPAEASAGWAPGTRPKLVLFDLDGTLSDSAPGITTSMAHALRAHGHAVPDATTLGSFVGPPLHRSLTDMGLARDEIDDIVATYREHYGAGGLFDTTLYPGITDALAALRSAGVTMAVATSKPQEMARRIIAHFELEHFFHGGLDGVFGADPARPHDTKADVITRALVALGFDDPPRGVVMVGDRLHDVEGAAAHAIPAIGVAWGYAGEGELLAAGALDVVETPSRLVSLLLG